FGFLCPQYRLDALYQFYDNRVVLNTRPADKYRFRRHDIGKRFETVAAQRAPGGYDIADRIAQSEPGRYLNRPGDGPDIGLDTIVVEKLFQDNRIGGSNGFPFEVPQPGGFALVRNGNFKCAFSETKPLQVSNRRFGFVNNIFADNPKIGNAVLYVFRNIVVAEKQDFQREICYGSDQRTFVVFEVQSAVF